jgi:hypothetical protein
MMPLAFVSFQGGVEEETAAAAKQEAAKQGVEKQ